MVHIDHIFLGSIETLKAILPSLSSSIESVASPTQHSGQVPSQHAGEMGQPSMAERDAALLDELAAVQQITQLLPPTSCATLGSISLIDLGGATRDGTQWESSSIILKEKAGRHC